MAEVQISNVTKAYGETQVIHGIDMNIEHGEFIVIVGPSGCGKSTLLRMVAGLEEITGGEMLIKGKLVNRLEPKDRDIAMVFQNYALYPHMSVFENMAYGLKIKKIARGEIEKRVREAAKLLQLEEYLERKPRQLSGGQRQRVAMGRAIVREPAVFLFDEPLSNLDAKLRVQMRLEIRKLQKRLNVTSLYVTHDQVEAMTMADRLIVLNGGVAEQIGTPMEIYNDPASQFVAGFIGSPSMNFIPADLSGDKISLGQALSLPRPGHLTHNGKAALGIRPEHFDLAAENEQGLAFEVDVVEPLGSETLVHGRLHGVDEDVVVRLPDSPPLENGQQISLTVRPDRLYLFDADHGKRLR
ncbi:ABC transporter ATP-binding protein [Aestuariispira insulae]|uniref:Carbohydrate ABC transporter ATP-binding protein (CUT1 family) n=1 Tax=Aestuariispira insulae TaxID=1461337 RepID=A0A3D9HWW8_9PROT|nr:sn-glycerol-3-phosphate import ATP-binding protein UgpC [Aestuariispira insulae]RED53900.1 carbohydrate ABC transporter ATP-binding protein (CUT1 family) [Aestuariispira insulae]